MRTIFAECGKSRWFLPSLFALCMILWFLRKPDSILAAQPFAEDATVFLADAIQASWASLSFSHQEYLNVIPQTIANFSLDLFGLAGAPLFMQLAAMSIDTLCAVFFSTSQFRFIIKSDLLRACCSLFIILVPGVVQLFEYNVSAIEYFLNIFLMLFTTLLLFNYDEFAKKPLKIKYLYAFFCSITFLTSAYSVVLLPAFVYVTVRQLVKGKKELSTILSYALPIIPALVQVSTLYHNHLQNYNAQTGHLDIESARSFLLLFAGGIAKIFYYNADSLFQQMNWPIYLISLAVIAFVLLNSIKAGLKFEIYTLGCIIVISFLTAIIRGSQYLAFAPDPEGGTERYFFFTMVFSFILLARQFDKRRTTVSKVVFVVVAAVIVFNVASGFFIPPFPDMNYEKFAKLYTLEGKYSCLISVVPYHYFFVVPCLWPTSVNQTITTLAFPQHAIAGNVTFTVTVSPSPNGGSILIYIDGKQAAKPFVINGGQTTLRMPLAPGSHKIFASYSESPNFSASNSSLAAVTVYSTSNLKGAELSDANLYEMNLSYSDLSGADLFGARLADANLAGANLEKANLTLAFMPGVDIRRGNLHGSNLQNANLQDSDLVDADLSGDNLVGAVLAGADLSGANLSGANLSGANLRDSDIAQANFTGAITDNCNGCPQMK